MAVRNGSYVAVAGAALALSFGLGAGAQGQLKSELKVRQEAGPAPDAGVSSSGVRLLGGTVCLPGTGMVFYSGPPEHEGRNVADEDRPAAPETDRPPADAAKDGKTGSDAGVSEP
jgi:hypothetical protein